MHACNHCGRTYVGAQCLCGTRPREPRTYKATRFNLEKLRQMDNTNAVLSYLGGIHAKSNQDAGR